MKKTISFSILVVVIILGTFIFFSKKDKKEALSNKLPTQLTSDETKVKKEPELTKNSSIEKEEQKKEIEKSSNTEKTVSDKKTENEIYEEALQGVVDEKQLRESMDTVFSRYTAEQISQESISLRNSINDRIYSEGVYDTLMKKNIQFTEVTCKETLCKLDFNMPTSNTDNSDFEIFNTLLGNQILTPEHGAKFQSRTNDGMLSFYISNEMISTGNF